VTARRAEILDQAATLFASSGIRTSLKEIADASGILPGSLYHHFESKEAIIVELVDRFHDDLDRLAAEAVTSIDHDERSVSDQLVALGSEIAACALRHRAALLLTLYDPPPRASEQLVQASTRGSGAIERAVEETLRLGQARGEIRAGLDLATLADRLCQVLLHVSLGVFRDVRGASDVPAIRCRTLLQGVAEDLPGDDALDRSVPFEAANQTIAGWMTERDDEDPRLAILRAAARREFGRHGYEATTVRDIAKAAEISTGTVYRLVGSKDELLGSIMRSFEVRARSGWRRVLRSEGSAVEKLDALTWININAVDRFRDEYNIQLAWIRESPPSTANLGASFAARLSDLKSLLARGIRSGELRVEGRSADLRAWSLFELLWMPESVVQGLGPAGALRLARETTLRGAAPR
jgi:AcrR family transcriptional regulator